MTYALLLGGCSCDIIYGRAVVKKQSRNLLNKGGTLIRIFSNFAFRIILGVNLRNLRPI